MKTGWMKMVGLVCGVVAALTFSIQAAPPGPTLPEYVAKAERIVVGKLDPWETHKMLPAKPGAKGPWAFRYAVVQIQVREVLKGPADLKTVPVRLCVGWVDKPVDESVVPGVYQSGADGVWILTREEGQYVGPCFAAARQPEIIGLLKQQPPAKTPPVEESAVKPIRLPDHPAPKPSGFAIQGTIKAVDLEKQTITATARWQTGSQDYTETVTTKTQITLNAKPAALADLKPGMAVQMAIIAKGTRYVEWMTATAAIAPETKTGTLIGMVVDEHGKALAGAKVTLDSPPRTDASQRTLATTTTSFRGEFHIEGIPPGDGYVIAAETKDRWGSKDKIPVQAGQMTTAGQVEIKPRAKM